MALPSPLGAAPTQRCETVSVSSALLPRLLLVPLFEHGGWKSLIVQPGDLGSSGWSFRLFLFSLRFLERFGARGLEPVLAGAPRMR